jgi:hypothetical protein
MVIGDLYFVGVPVLPDETDATLIIYPDTVLPLPVAFQGFQTVAGNCGQVAERFRLIQMDQLAERRLFDEPELPRRYLLKQLFGRGVSKSLNHKLIVYR